MCTEWEYLKVFLFCFFFPSIELSCPQNSEYHLCSSHMSDCVEKTSPLAVKCKEGCFCKPGFFHSDGECVPNAECGCIYNGVYHKIHENFYPDELSTALCLCRPQQSTVYKPHMSKWNKMCHPGWSEGMSCTTTS